MMLDPAVKMACIAATPPTIAAVASLIISLKNHGNIKLLHINLNSRLTELLATTQQSSHATGRAEGVEAERIRKEQKG